MNYYTAGILEGTPGSIPGEKDLLLENLKDS